MATQRGHAAVFSEKHAHGGRGHGTQNARAKAKPLPQAKRTTETVVATIGGDFVAEAWHRQVIMRAVPIVLRVWRFLGGNSGVGRPCDELLRQLYDVFLQHANALAAK
jgi:hypothetical protein